jgi:hypothetical protein
MQNSKDFLTNEIKKAAKIAADEILASLEQCKECCDEQSEEQSSIDLIRGQVYEIMGQFRDKNSAQALINLGRLSMTLDRLSDEQG